MRTLIGRKAISAVLTVLIIVAALVVLERSTEAQQPTRTLVVSAPMTVSQNDMLRLAVFNASTKTIEVRPHLLDGVTGAIIDDIAVWDTVLLAPRTGSIWDLENDGAPLVAVGVLEVRAARRAARRLRGSLQVFDAKGNTQVIVEIDVTGLQS